MTESLPENIEPYPGISSKAYEHPADRAATAALKAVPMLDTVELDVPGGLSCCLRVLLLTARDEAVRHAYLGRARELRPDLEEPP